MQKKDNIYYLAGAAGILLLTVLIRKFRKMDKLTKNFTFAEFESKRGFLSPKQLEVARKKMPKYAKQLADIANGKLSAEGN